MSSSNSLSVDEVIIILNDDEADIRHILCKKGLRFSPRRKWICDKSRLIQRLKKLTPKSRIQFLIAECHRRCYTYVNTNQISHRFPSRTLTSFHSDVCCRACPPLALYQISPPHLKSRSAAAVGPSTAGLTSK